MRAAHLERIQHLKANYDTWEAKLKAAEEKRQLDRNKKVEALHEHVRTAGPNGLAGGDARLRIYHQILDVFISNLDFIKIQHEIRRLSESG